MSRCPAVGVPTVCAAADAGRRHPLICKRVSAGDTHGNAAIIPFEGVQHLAAPPSSAARDTSCALDNITVNKTVTRLRRFRQCIAEELGLLTPVVFASSFRSTDNPKSTPLGLLPPAPPGGATSKFGVQHLQQGI